LRDAIEGTVALATLHRALAGLTIAVWSAVVVVGWPNDLVVVAGLAAVLFAVFVATVET
jgi:hypothetical protein